MMYELLLNLAATVVITVIGVFGAWLSLKLAKKQELSNIAAATEQVILAAQLTVGELQQCIVDELKANGNKLTSAEIAMLNKELVKNAGEKLSTPAATLLEKANVDISSLIRAAGEEWISRMK